MALLLGELAAKPLDENGLGNRIGVKKHDQSDQTKYNINDVDPKNGFRAAPHCGESEDDNCNNQEEGDKNRVAPDPPIALLNFLKRARQLLLSRLYRSGNGMNGRSTHGLEVRDESSPTQPN